MFAFLDSLRELSTLSVVVRLFLATICGGLVGLEREFNRRPAGFRTHILICLGAAMTTLTSQYLLLEAHLFTDIARLGAQVVAGIGFIGAGCIIVTRRRRVKGLTTAAGLWASAIVGLALGAGYFEGGIYATLLVLTVEIVFGRLEKYLLSRVPELNVYVEYDRRNTLEDVLHLLREQHVTVSDLEVTRSADDGHRMGAILALSKGRKWSLDELVSSLQRLPGVLTVEEL